MATLTKAERKERERLVRSLIHDGKSIPDVAEHLGISRQAVWEFCARRGIAVPEETRVGIAAKIVLKDERRRRKRAARRSIPEIME